MNNIVMISTQHTHTRQPSVETQGRRKSGKKVVFAERSVRMCENTDRTQVGMKIDGDLREFNNS